MRYLRQIIIASLIGLTLLFNIERLDFGRENIVDIDSFVYVLGFLAALAILIFPLFWRSHAIITIVFWIGIYFLGKLFIFNHRPLFGGIYTYLSITELTLLSISTWLAHALARAIRDFEKAVENITFRPVSRRVRRLKDATEDIQVEMFRSRHNHHPLSVVVVEPKPELIQTKLHEAVQEVQQTMLRTYVINSMAQTISKYLRRTDLVLEQRDQGRFIVFCPETNAQELRLLVDYIQTIAKKKLGTAVTCGVATFPDEALTFEELIQRAETQLQQSNGSPTASKVELTELKKSPEVLVQHPNGSNGTVK